MFGFTIFLIVEFGFALVLGLDFWRKFNNNKRASRRDNGVKVQPLRENSIVISCPSCRKTFGKPLVMLDFNNGKAKLVSVCPYCNARLGNNGEKEGARDVEVGVLGQDEQVKTEQ